jgi:hypothetical protein
MSGLRQYQKASFGLNTEFRDVWDGDPLPTRAFAGMPIASSSFTRPANTTAYAALDAVSDNNVLAASVTPLTFSVSDINDAPVALYRILCRTTDTGPGTAGGGFKLYLFNVRPTSVVVDNATWLPTSMTGYIGAFTAGSFELFSDGSVGVFAPEKGTMLQTKPGTGTKLVYGLLQTINGFTPLSASVWTFTTEGQQGR